MKTKLRFLFVLLTMLWWGANYAWGENNYEFYSAEFLINTGNKFTAHFKNTVHTYTGLSLSTTLISGIEKDIPNAMKLESEQWITFSTTGTSTVVVGVYMGNDNKNSFYFDGKAYSIAQTAKGSYGLVTITNVTAGDHSITKNHTDVGIYYVKVSEGLSYADSYPYTWDFTKWETTSDKLIEDVSHWNTSCEYTTSLNVDGGASLLYGDGELPETKGLKFKAAAILRVAAHPNETHSYLYATGTHLYIPNLKKGYQVKFRVSAHSSTSNAISYNSEGKKAGGGRSISELTFTVVNDGTGEFFIEANQVYIYSITVDKGTLSEFSVNPNDVFKSSDAGCTTDVADITSTHFEITKDNNALYLRLKLNVETDQNVEDLSLDVTKFSLVSNSSSNVLDVSELSFVRSTTNRVYVKGLKIKAPGYTTLTFKYNGSDAFKEQTCEATLHIIGSETPTITMSKNSSTVVEDATQPTTYGNKIKVTGTSSAGLTVKYRSEDESIATVNNKGEVTPVNSGTTKIYVYTEGSGDYNPVETYYNLNVDLAEFDLHFMPNSGKVGKGRTITPYIDIPSLNIDDITSISATISPEGIASIPSDLLDHDDNGKYTYLDYNATTGDIYRFKPIITGVEKGNATITVTFVSSKYNVPTPATYTVTVTDDVLNFDWANNSAITMYEGDYMMMPAITGNANGYVEIEGQPQKYVYSMTQNSTKVDKLNYYNKEYHPGEGDPLYSIVEEGNSDEKDQKAYILFAESSEGRGSVHPDGLMIYARKAGTVKIHAVDTQNNLSPSDLTLTILPKANIYSTESGSEGELIVEQKSISYPYTWDFTKNFTLATNSYYWEENSSGWYGNGLALQNSDYADDNHSGNTTGQGGERLFKALLADHHTIPLFKGMQVQLQGTSYNSKYGRIQLKPTAGEGNAHFRVEGGPQVFDLPRPGTGMSEPTATYRLYVKVKSNGTNRGIVRYYKNGTGAVDIKCEYDNADDKESGIKHPFVPLDYDGDRSAARATEKIFSFDYSNGDKAYLGLQDVDVYWIAFSTEAREAQKKGITNYAAATYCYPEDLDLEKSCLEGVNTGLKAYYASDFSSNTVTLSPITGYVEANTGLILKATNTQDNYLIANAKNAESYSAPKRFVDTGSGGEGLTNYLKPAPSGTTIKRFVNKNNEAVEYADEADIKFTNFVLSSQYKQVDDNGSSYVDKPSGYQNSDWMFYRVNGTSTSTKNMSYLQLPNKQGDLDGVSQSSSRRMVDTNNEGHYSLSNLIRIIFADEINNDIETTNISSKSIERKDPDNDGWYTLQGVEVKKPAKGGIYIHKGKKIVLK